MATVDALVTAMAALSIPSLTRRIQIRRRSAPLVSGVGHIAGVVVFSALQVILRSFDLRPFGRGELVQRMVRLGVGVARARGLRDTNALVRDALRDARATPSEVPWI